MLRARATQVPSPHTLNRFRRVHMEPLYNAKAKGARRTPSHCPSNKVVANHSLRSTVQTISGTMPSKALTSEATTGSKGSAQTLRVRASGGYHNVQETGGYSRDGPETQSARLLHIRSNLTPNPTLVAHVSARRNATASPKSLSFHFECKKGKAGRF